MTYNVKITPYALQDMEEIYDYIVYELQVHENVMAQYDRIASAILSLDEYPERFRLVLFESEHSQGLDQMVVDNYLFFCLIESAEVIITNVLYSASDLETRLK
jgi:toxin ParE1/3/4